MHFGSHSIAYVLQNANNKLDHDSDIEDQNISKIEPTMAEEEALARGLQVLASLLLLLLLRASIYLTTSFSCICLSSLLCRQ